MERWFSLRAEDRPGVDEEKSIQIICNNCPAPTPANRSNTGRCCPVTDEAAEPTEAGMGDSGATVTFLKVRPPSRKSRRRRFGVQRPGFRENKWKELSAATTAERPGASPSGAAQAQRRASSHQDTIQCRCRETVPHADARLPELLGQAPATKVFDDLVTGNISPTNEYFILNLNETPRKVAIELMSFFSPLRTLPRDL